MLTTPPSQLSPTAKWVNGCKRPWVCNSDHRALGLLDTSGIDSEAKCFAD